MAKDKNLTDPFKAFNVLKGGFGADESANNDIPSDISTDDNILEEPDQIQDEERLAAGDAALAKVIEKTTKKEKPVVEEEEEKVETPIDSEEESEDNEPSKSNGIREFAKSLYEKNILDFDDSDEDFVDEEEGLENLVNKTVENRISKWSESLDPDFVKLLEFTQNGGNPRDFLNIYYGEHSWSNFSLENENNQRAAVAESLRLAGESNEDIEDIITEWSDNGTLEKRAKSALNKLQKFEDAQKEEILRIQQAQKIEQQKAQKAYWDTFKDELMKKEDIKGFKLTPKVKENLWNFMTAVDRKTGKTAYQQAVDSDREASILFALQAMNKFDVSKLEKQVETKVASKYHNLLKNYTKSSKDKISSGRTDESYDANPFQGFKNLK